MKEPNHKPENKHRTILILQSGNSLDRLNSVSYTLVLGRLAKTYRRRTH